MKNMSNETSNRISDDKKESKSSSGCFRLKRQPLSLIQNNFDDQELIISFCRLVFLFRCKMNKKKFYVDSEVCSLFRGF